METIRPDNSNTATPYLEIIATELWFTCWTLCSRRQLRRLSAVCKLFRNICLPLLFEDQTIEVGGGRYGITRDNWNERIHGLHRAAVRLDALAHSSHTDSFRSWRFGALDCSGPSPRSEIKFFELFESTYTRLVMTFSTTLRLYRNLQSLHLEAFVIDAPFRQSLSELSRLEDLTLHSCDIVERNGFAMKLRSFAISERKLPQRDMPRQRQIPRKPLTMVAPESLHTLHLDSVAETAPLLAGFGHAQFDHLVVLSFEHVSHVDILLDFLARCPKIEALTITTVRPDVIASLPRYTLSPNTTPVLRDLTVRAEMLNLFSSDRPIGTVTILNEPVRRRRHPAAHTEDFMRALNELLKASVPLLSLSLPETTPTPELLTGITSLFPHLQQLSIRILQPRSSIHSGSSDPPPLPSVKRRCPVLSDADVFNNIPEDDLSDAEQGEPPSVALVQIPQKLALPSSATKLHQVLRWIFDGTASLPPEIEILRLIWDENLPFVWAKFGLREQQEIVAMLSNLYPRLREVRIGYSDSVWNRDGAVWRKCGTDSYMQVVQRTT
ncbi:hypothetical protein C8R45DRAFT_999986 [Mycena sanguinolenta]|nr:hypothetical protein C8R45DRAFT_999986 [Mycena sanguinolenta]